MGFDCKPSRAWRQIAHGGFLLRGPAGPTSVAIIGRDAAKQSNSIGSLRVTNCNALLKPILPASFGLRSAQTATSVYTP